MRPLSLNTVFLHLTTSSLLVSALYLSLTADEKLWPFILGLSAGSIRELNELARSILELAKRGNRDD